jgi:N-acetylneuraminic acid mutarotase
MDRMAQHTEQPELLRELFEALGNNPFVIAECLARPILSERLKDATFGRRKGTLAPLEARAPVQVTVPVAAVSANYTLPTISSPSAGCTDDTWTPTSTTNAPAIRDGHTAVWTGSQMIVWGGASPFVLWNTGGRYDPATNSWTDTSTAAAPSARYGHTAVWTGSEMIVWGGANCLAGCLSNTGGRYNPATDSWTAISNINAPTNRYTHTAVWTGNEMIVWGGYDGSSQLDSGGRYNPSTDTWAATSSTNAPNRRDRHTAVWTGNEMIVWGGYFWDGAPHFLNTGARYNPNSDSWTATSTANTPTGRYIHTAIWTGSEMIVWGGVTGNSLLNTGGRYNPSTDSWTATTTTGAPTSREYHTAVWTGNEMIVWGGFGGSNYGSPGRYAAPDAPAVTPTPSEPPATPTSTPTPTPTASPSPGTGGRYNPTTDSWRATSTPPNAPAPRDGQTAVWTGSEMIIWGGAGPGYNLNTGGRYCAQFTPVTPTPTATATATLPPSPTPTPTPTATPTPCTGRCSPTPRPHPSPAPRP